MKYNRKAVISAIILALALIIAFIFAVKKQKVEAPMNQSSSLSKLDISKDLTQSPSTYRGSNLNNNLNQEDKATGISLTGVPVLSYTDTFMKFRNNNIIQLSNGCQSRPTSIVVANGSQILLDNRADNSEVITIGDNKYDIDAYGFKVITLDVSKIPSVYTIDCKVAQNVTTLTVE